ncbi:hypothetical protein J6590_053410 [Homalodisca vitripennis]|nr:hypothetical protein J6590_053410 [Homalodisca vitripennis]
MSTGQSSTVRKESDSWCDCKSKQHFDHQSDIFTPASDSQSLREPCNILID